MQKVVKIKLRQLIISLTIGLLLLNIAYASGEHLAISNIDVKLVSKTVRNLHNGDVIPEDARPGQLVEFRVEVANNFSNTDDVRIEDITVKTTIEGIDDGNDLEIESDRFDLRADTERKVIFKFDIPLEVLEDSFNVIIEAEGQDENGTLHFVESKLKLEVQKDNHKLIVIKKALTPIEVSCSKKNIQLTLVILNTGNFDEEAVTVMIKNRDLGIDIKDQIGELKSRPNEPESRFSKVYPLRISDDAEAGSYPINIKVLYNDDRQVTDESVTLTVSECGKLQPVVTIGTKDQEGTEVIMPPPEKKPEPKPDQLLPEGTVLTQESFISGNGLILIVIIAEVIAVIIGSIAVTTLFRKRS